MKQEYIHASPGVKTRVLKAALIFLFLLSGNSAFAQCSPAPPPDITCMAGTALTSGANVNSGVYTFCSSGGNLNNINLSGGTLQICGQVSISNLTFNSGTIQVAQYGQLTLNGGVTLNNNCTIVNYGTLQVNGNMVFQNQNNTVQNARIDAKMLITGSISFPVNTNQFSYFVNKGYVTAGGLTLTDGCTSFCLENGSYIGLGSFTLNLNNINNPITYGNAGGSATIRYSASASLGSNASKSVTLSSHVTICRATGATLSGSGSWGSATLTTGCAAVSQPAQSGVVTTCYTLPVEWLGFSGAANGNEITLEWETATEQNNDYFQEEVSRDGTSFEKISRTPGSGSSSQPHSYSMHWQAPSAGDYYFRLKQVDYNGQFDYSRMIYVHVPDGSEISSPFPNPFADVLQLELPQDLSFSNCSFSLYNSMGQLQLRTNLVAGKSEIAVSELAAGVYVTVITNANGEVLRRDVLVKSQR